VRKQQADFAVRVIATKEPAAPVGAHSQREAAMAASDTLKKVAIAPAVGARLPAMNDGAVLLTNRAA